MIETHKRRSNVWFFSFVKVNFESEEIQLSFGMPNRSGNFRGYRRGSLPEKGDQRT